MPAYTDRPRSFVAQLTPEPLLPPLRLPALPWRGLLRSDIEGLSFYASLGWALVLSLRPGLFEQSKGFYAMAQLASQPAWAVLVALGSAVQAWGLLSGRSRPRLVGSTVGAAWWVFIALMITTVGISTGAVTYGLLATLLAVRTFRASA